MWNSELVRTKLELVTCMDQCDNQKVGGKKLGICVFQIHFCKQVVILLLVRGGRESLVN